MSETDQPKSMAPWNYDGIPLREMGRAAEIILISGLIMLASAELSLSNGCYATWGLLTLGFAGSHMMGLPNHAPPDKPGRNNIHRQ